LEQKLTAALTRSTGLIFQWVSGAQRVCAPTWAGVKESGEWRRRCVRCAATASVITVDVESASCRDLHVEASDVKLITHGTLYLGPRVASTH